VIVDLLGFSPNAVLAALLIPALWAPVLIELVFRVPLPRVIQLFYLIFMAAGPFAGSVLHLYGGIIRLDNWVHFASGVMLTWLSLYAIRVVEERSGLSLPRWLTLTFAIVTAMAFAAAWEICEFLSDLVLHTTAQADNLDTMIDLVMGTGGAILAILIVVVGRRPRSVLPLSLQGDRRDTYAVALEGETPDARP
jgi:hypothetical protein